MPHTLLGWYTAEISDVGRWRHKNQKPTFILSYIASLGNVRPKFLKKKNLEKASTQLDLC